MARRHALNAETLAALGAERLATLLMDLAEGDTAIRKRLVLAAAEAGGEDALTKALDRRLSALASSRGYIAWEKARAYAAELDGLRATLAETLAPLNAPAAAERLSRFIRMAPRVFERADDSDGRFGDVFRTAVLDLVASWKRSGDYDQNAMAADVFLLVHSDEYGVCDGLVTAAAPALGPSGLAALAGRVRAALAEGGQADTPEVRSARLSLGRVLRDVADAQHDVDGFIALAEEEGGRIDVVGIARRLLGASRSEEALQWLDRATDRPALRVAHPAELAEGLGSGYPIGIEWEREGLRIRALEALRRRDEAQEVRWRLFGRTLNADMLRAYLKALPDFEDAEALDLAFGLASAHPNVLLALDFFIEWPNHNAAAKLVLDQADHIDGRHYDLLTLAAEALAHAHPLAATLLYRKMIDSVLARAASKAYTHAARNLASCKELATRIDWSAVDLISHLDYEAGLLAMHPRKAGFWAVVRGR